MAEFDSKDWKDWPDTSTPLTAAAMEDLEQRLATFVVDASSDIPMGPPGPMATHRGVWSSIVSYNQLDVVTHNGAAWWCLANGSLNQEPGHAEDWTLMVEDGDPGAIGPAGPAGADSTVPGPKGDKGDPGLNEYAYISNFSSPGAVTDLGSGSSWKVLPVSSAIVNANTPVGAFTRNADGTVTFNQAGVYNVEASVGAIGTAWTTNGVPLQAALGIGSTPAIAATNVFAKSFEGNVGTNGFPWVTLAGMVKVAAGDILNVIGLPIANGGNVYVVNFGITRLGAGPAGPTGPAGSSAVPPLVSTLPGSPVDGQEVYYQDSQMAAIGAVWHLRYRAASASIYKWELVGGGKLRIYSNASLNTNQAVYNFAGTLTLSLPREGDYECGCSMYMRLSDALAASLAYGNLGQVSTNTPVGQRSEFYRTGAETVANQKLYCGSEDRIDSQPAGKVLRPYYKVDGGTATVTITEVEFWVRALRVM